MREAMKFVLKHWQIAGSVLGWVVCLSVSLGVAKGKYSDVQDRIDALEHAQPQATAAMTQRNAEEVAAVRLQINQISHDVSDVRVDVARLCVRFGLQPSGAVDMGGGVVSRPTQ